MRYDSDLLYRPPGEWRSYLLQCTIGCSHNKCTFCAMYKEKKFRVRPVEEILEDIDMARSYYGPNVERVFLMDGDAIVMRTEQLLQILEKLYAAFPKLQKVTTYAGPRSTLSKTPEELRALREAGLTRAYLGVESGSDAVLQAIQKGCTAAEMLQAGQNLVAAGIDTCSAALEETLLGAGVSQVLVSLICEGIIAGVGGVLSFLPQIALLFFFLSFLEDIGYMSRAAFIMDRLLRRFGLSGKAFIPMLMGFGCSVPAIMGARTMENEKDRRMTILLVPFMSCSAKLPVYGLLSSAFFGPWAGLVVFGLYVIGMAAGILSGLLFKHTLFAGEPAPFVLELPPYRLPSLHNMLTHVWQKVKGFLIKAGTLILLMSILLWLLQSFDFSLHMVENEADSMLGALGSVIAPIFKPLGFGFWQAAVALLTGLIAKEMVVSSLSMFYAFPLTATGAQVAAAMTGFTPLSAFSMLVFILLYVPCVAAVSTLAKEMNSTKWTLFSIGWQLGVAYVASLLVYQVGSLFL